MSKAYRINFNSHIIHYYRYGQGNKVMLTFHGFGQQGDDFHPLAESLKNDFTTYSFDLFYHGKSHWGTPKVALTKEFWHDFLQFFLNLNSINTFSIAAFSMGGKFALVTIDVMPKRIERILLLAPDGIETQMWYNLATYPLVLRKYFQTMIVKPKRFFRILNTIKTLGLLDRGISKFAATQMSSVKKRRRVYYSWVVFKDLQFDLQTIAEKLNQEQLEVEMYLGKYDKIITRKGMNRLLKYVQRHNVHVLNCGHNNLISHVAAFLKQNE